MAQGKAMNMHPIDGSTFMTIVTIGFYSFSVICKITAPIFGSITWQSAAGVMAVLAGGSTFMLNLYRFYKEYKKNKKE